MPGMSAAAKSRRNEYRRVWRKNNRDKVRAQEKRWRERYPEKQAAQMRRNYEKHSEARRVAAKQRRLIDPRKSRSVQMKAVYGMTLDQYDEMLLSQNGRCAACGDEEPAKRRLAIDHNHRTGVVRGLLCTNCNLAIGHVRDDIQRLRLLISYLESRV